MEFFTTIQKHNSLDGISWEIGTALCSSRNDKFAISESGCRVALHQQNVDEVRQCLSGIAFIDSGLDDYQSLVAGVAPGIEVVVLESTQDGVEQISRVLAKRQRIGSVHIVSHGAPGAIYIGNSELSLETLNHYGNELLSWAEMLAPNAEVLIYGCEVAKGDRGQAFIHRLSELTGAAVAASASKTGSAVSGGNWSLEKKVGTIKEASLFSEELKAAYTQVFSINPSSIKVSNFTGGDVGEGLDLDGTFVYAINFAGSAVGAIRDANFTSDTVSGVSTGAQYTYTFPAEYGSTQNDNRLEQVMRSLRWSSNPNNSVTVDLANLTIGKTYKAQLLFNDSPSNRYFDVLAENQLLVDNINTVGNSATGKVLTFEFIATDTVLNLRLTPPGTAPSGYYDPIINGLTLEEINTSNTAPNFTSNAVLVAIPEDTTNSSGQSIMGLFIGLFNDPDVGASLSGLAIVGNTANATTEGIWQYSSNGTDWFDVGTVADSTTGLALSATTAIRFVPVANYNGTPSALTVRALDNTYSAGFTNGATRVTVNTTTNGGSSAISATTNTINSSITAVNDAPIGSPTATLATGTEETPYTINKADLLAGFSDVDGDSLSVSNVTANGTVLTADSNGNYTFTPAANFNGTVELSYNLVDGNGGSVAATQSFAIAPVNDAPTNASITGLWTFEPGATLTELTGNFGNLTLFGGATVSNGQLDVNSGQFANAINYTGPTITNKTLVSWVYLDNLNVGSGSVLTIDSPTVDRFDGIVYAERQTNRWMAGSTNFQRTQDPTPGFQETTPNKLVQMAVSYENVGGSAKVSLYHDGTLIGSYTQGPIASWSAGDAEVIFGARHTGGTTQQIGNLDARIEHAMIFNQVLTMAPTASHLLPTSTALSTFLTT
jgi:hypothetical protein